MEFTIQMFRDFNDGTYVVKQNFIMIAASISRMESQLRLLYCHINNELYTNRCIFMDYGLRYKAWNVV